MIGIGFGIGLKRNGATKYPAGIRISSVDSSVLVADAANEFYFNDGAGNDLPFSILAIVKSNNLSVGNTLISRGNASGMSFYAHLNNSAQRIDWSIYGSDDPSVSIYCSSSTEQDSSVNRMVFTYAGNKNRLGMKIYKNGVECDYLARENFGSYSNMNNRSGLHIGELTYYSDNYGRFDIYTLLIANKELSQEEITEFQDMSSESDISSLSFYSNLKLIERFAGTLNSDVGSHDGSSDSPTFFY